jgi:hypothetical protein
VSVLFLVIPNKSFTILALIAIAVGLYLLFVGSQLVARKRLLASTATSKICDALPGLVEVNGLACGPYDMPSPIAGKPCFLYRTTVWQQRDRRAQEWEKVADETLHLPFFIDDASGRLLIEPLGADLDLRCDFREEYDAESLFGNLDRPRVSAFLSRHAIVPTRPICIEERTIKLGDAIFVAGTLMANPGVQARAFSPHGEAPPNGSSSRSRRDSTTESESNSETMTCSDETSRPEVIRLPSGTLPSSSYEMTQQAKIAAALTRAGVTKPEAWSAAGIPYEASYKSLAVEERAPNNADGNADRNRNKEQDRKKEQVSGFDLTPPVVLMKEANQPVFTISCRSQKETIGALAWKSAALCSAGTAIAVLGFYPLLDGSFRVVIRTVVRLLLRMG